MNGINYYHESMGYIARTAAQVDADMERIVKKFTSIKLYHNPFLPDRLAIISTIVKSAKAHGLYVVWAENDDTIELNETNWSEYTTAVKNDCVLADRLGVDEFIVGNEISIHNDNTAGFNDTNLPIRIKQLVEECRYLSKMITTYQDGWWKKDSWDTAKLENLQKIHFTLYEDIANFETHARDIYKKFGKSAVIGEWSTQSTLAESATDERDWTEQLLQRKMILEREGLDSYYFCFRDTGVDNNDKGFGLWKNTIEQPHLVWNLI